MCYWENIEEGKIVKYKINSNEEDKKHQKMKQYNGKMCNCK